MFIDVNSPDRHGGPEYSRLSRNEQLSGKAQRYKLCEGIHYA